MQRTGAKKAERCIRSGTWEMIMESPPSCREPVGKTELSNRLLPLFCVQEDLNLCAGS